MKKVILLCIVIILITIGCSKINYSKEFVGVPIYPGAELILNNEFDNQVAETYSDMTFKGDIEKVKSFFEKNIDKNIWTIEEPKKPLTGHNVDKMYGYILKSKDQNASLTIAYTNSNKTGKHISITIIGDKVHQNSDKSWVESTIPRNDEKDVSTTSNITVKFNTDIDAATLNKQNITVEEAKHTRIITDLYDITYDKASRTLLLKFNSDYGTGNGITVTLSTHIKNAKGEEMGADYKFGFSTK